MKNKKVLKKWVQVVLGLVMIMAMLVGAADCEITKIFIIKGLICSVVMAVCFVLLKKYTNIFEESEENNEV